MKKALIAGHICLDIIPDLSSVPQGQFRKLLQPGRLIKAGRATLTTGGTVTNTGLALHRLGIPVLLIGKIGDDDFGRTVSQRINQIQPDLSADLVRDPNVPTSYTIILNPPGFDRTFLHCPGANDFFYASDLPRKKLQEADLFHFGYPTLMRSIFRWGGAELISILRRARTCGLTTSLDFSFPDPTSPAGQADWPTILYYSLPYVDLFLPSIEELCYMLDRETFETLSRSTEGPFPEAVSADYLHELSDQLLDLGVKIVMIKLGQRGVYLRTAPTPNWRKGGRALEGFDQSWHDRELWAPAFAVTVQGTTGAGDTAIAGFLSSLLRGSSPETALQMAAGAGACCVSARDARSDLPPWDHILERIRSGWETLPLEIDSADWKKDTQHGLWKRR